MMICVIIGAEYDEQVMGYEGLMGATSVVYDLKITSISPSAAADDGLMEATSVLGDLKITNISPSAANTSLVRGISATRDCYLADIPLGLFILGCVMR